jgi:hypothetical protein
VLSSEELELQFNLAAGSDYTVGYSERRGDGRLTVLGLAPNPALLLAIHQFAGVPIPVRSRLPGVTTALFRAPAGRGFYLCAVNNGGQDVLAGLTLDPDIVPPGRYAARELLSGESRAVTLGRDAPLTVSLPRKDGTVLHLAPEPGVSR